MRLCLLAMVCAALVAGCGDDDDDNGGGTTATAVQADAAPQTFGDPLPPQTAKPNIVGGNAPIAEFGANAFNQAVAYWTALTKGSNIPYVPPTAEFVSQVTPACNDQPYDPTKIPSSLCVDPQKGGKIWYSIPILEQLRSSAGDAGAAFLIGWLPALDINNLVSGNNPVATGKVTDAFLNRTACFEGSWFAYLNERRLLEAGDSEEIQKALVQVVGGASSNEIKTAAVKLGYDKGAAACQAAYPD